MSVTSRYPLIKSIDEVFLVNMDFSLVLNTGNIITINSLTVDNNTLSLSNSGVTLSGITFSVSGGVNNTNYRISANVQTSDNEKLSGEGILKVRDI
jgi:hypothetical protein